MFNEYVRSSIPQIPVHVDNTCLEGMKKGRLSRMHLHDEIELVHVECGVFEIDVEDKKYIATKGTTFFINSRIPHSTYALTDGTSGILLQFRAEDFFDKKIHSISKYLPRFANAYDRPILLFENEEELCGNIEKIMKEYSKKDTAYQVYVLAGVYGILAFLYRERILIDASSYYDAGALMKLLPVLEYIDENYNKDLTLDVISSHFGLNPSYFSRMFKKAVGSVYTEYLNFVRICKAEKLLKETDMGILDVALEVGFSSVSYFNRVFKRVRNCTPTTYKNAMKPTTHGRG